MVGRETVDYVGNIYKYYVAILLVATVMPGHGQEIKEVFYRLGTQQLALPV